MIKHKLHVSVSDCDFNESLNDYVYTIFVYLYSTVDSTDPQNLKKASTWGTIKLSDADPNNFLPYKEVTRENIQQWVESALQDLIPNLQAENIGKLK